MKASLLEIVMASPCFISRAYSSELFAVCDAVWRLITVATYVLIYSEIETCSLRQIFIAVLYHVWYAAFVLQVKAYRTIVGCTIKCGHFMLDQPCCLEQRY